MVRNSGINVIGPLPPLSTGLAVVSGPVKYLVISDIDGASPLRVHSREREREGGGEGTHKICPIGRFQISARTLLMAAFSKYSPGV